MSCEQCDQLKAECEKLTTELCREVIKGDDLQAELDAMTKARDQACELLDNAADPSCSPKCWAALRAVGGEETT